ncbi:MAG TPA: alpha-glucan family phosphorylase [Acidiferrobacter sp.]|nr:alpha-glucan family phosphorylase [Acidiferrobacter sp.]
MSTTPYIFLPTLPPPLEGLTELALDLRWSWHHSADTLWERMDAELWSATHNPWIILQNVSGERLQQLATDQDFIANLQESLETHKEQLASASWYEQQYSPAPVRQIAYFSMEFGLSEALPIYSGGLGILAGDCLKTASDLGVPLVGIGLLWQQGYFRQTLDSHGQQVELYPYNDPTQLPVVPVREPNGNWLHISLPFPGRTIILRVWQARVGRTSLYLLDSNDPTNRPADRTITAELYGGGAQMRLEQELCLGMGGFALASKLGLNPEICHLNEGHAAFAVLARARDYRIAHGVDFHCALNATRAGNVFTTHTPVAAGFDRFSPKLLTQYAEGAPSLFGIPAATLLSLGQETPGGEEEPFNMAYLAIRGSILVNGVSQLHAQISRGIFQPLFPNWPQEEVPVIPITNGVHTPSWDSPAADELWTAACGEKRWIGGQDHVESDFRSVSDQELWTLRGRARQRLIDFTRRRLVGQLTAAGVPTEHIRRGQDVLDPHALTIGFARRFTAYKRPNMLLTDPDRLYRLLAGSQCPVQLVIAGKAHPQDTVGKAMIQQWTHFITQHPELMDRLVFLEDYDILLAEQLVQGVDLWINTPRRPWEASGTSGMKVLVNGGLNLSERDGWWAEAYTPEVGWALGDGAEHDEDPVWDRKEATDLYEILERSVVPLFYHDRNPEGCPSRWIAKMRESMAQLTPRFSANRMLRDYIEQLYIPAARLYGERADEGLVERLCTWQDTLNRFWNRLHFGDFQAYEDKDQGLYHFSVPVYLSNVEPNFINVQLYAIPLLGKGPDLHPMQRQTALGDMPDGYVYTLTLPKSRPIEDYTPRIVPATDMGFVPIEAPHILWYR